jgi:lysophospholipase L1-like esterase
MTSTRSGVRRLLIGVGTIAFWAAIAEVAFRIGFANSLDFNIEMWKYAVALKRPVADPQLSFVHVPNGHAHLMGVDVDINSQGLRDREYTLEKPPGTYRILMLGDSTTFGWGVRAEDTAAKILERELNAAGSDTRFEVINAGVGNYGTVQEVTYYRTRGRAFHPDVVVLVYFINDAEPVPQETSSFLRDRSYFVAFVVSRVDGLLRLSGRLADWRTYYGSLYDDRRPGWMAAQAALKDLAHTARQDDASVVVALLPELHEINGVYPFEREHARVRAAAEAAQIRTIDLLEGLRGHGPESSLWVTPLDDHPNAKANALVAAQLREWIQAREGIGRSRMIIQLTPNRSRSWPNLVAKNVSCIGMNTSPPSESAEKMRSASASLSTFSDR